MRLATSGTVILLDFSGSPLHDSHPVMPPLHLPVKLLALVAMPVGLACFREPSIHDRAGVTNDRDRSPVAARGGYLGPAFQDSVGPSYSFLPLGYCVTSWLVPVLRCREILETSEGFQECLLDEIGCIRLGSQGLANRASTIDIDEEWIAIECLRSFARSVIKDRRTVLVLGMGGWRSHLSRFVGH